MQALVDPSRYVLNWYALPAVLSGTVNALLGITTLRRERASGVSVAFCTMTIVVAVWLVAIGGLYSSGDASLALGWVRIVHLGACFIPASVFLFSAAVTGRLTESRWMIRAGFAAAAFIYTLDASTRWIVSGVQHYYFGYYPIFSLTLSPLLFAYFGFYLGASLHLYRGAIKSTRSTALRSRLKALLVALAISELAVVDFLPDFHVPVYPFGYVFIGAFTVISTWAILRYRLVDITPALAASEIVGAMADGLLVVDRDGVVRVANAAASATWGLRDSALGLSIEALDAAWSQDALARLIDPARQHQAEVVYLGPDGSRRSVQMSSSRLSDQNGIWVGTVFIIRDITERWRSERALRDSEERFRSLVQHATDLITVIDVDTTVRYQSPAIGPVLGFEADTVVGTRLADSIHRDDKARFVDTLADLMTNPGRVVTGEGRLRHVNGEWRDFQFTGTDQRENPAIGGLVLNARDVTDRRRLEDELRAQARHDPVTGLANRYRFTEHLEGALARHSRVRSGVAVLYLDLDGFKAINDRLGHTAGDALLRAVGERIVAVVRAGDLVARLGGDEFAVVLEPLESADEAAAAARRILTALEQPLCIDGGDVLASASIGIALPDADESTADRLLRNADVAMYAAKSRGRSRYEIYEAASITPASRQRRILEDDLYDALLNDGSGAQRRDPLTGAWNHAGIVDLVQREAARTPAAAFSVAAIDVHGLAEINDTFGHDAGDGVLRSLAQLLARNGAGVGRYGGGRFLVLLPDTHRVGAQAYVDDVTSAVGGLNVRDAETGSAVPVAVSTGVAAFPDEAATCDGVIRLAEGAMYAAKLRRSAQHGATARRLADRVANLTDEMVPLLTSSAPIATKIRLVAERLSDGLGYDAAECTLFGRAGEEIPASYALIAGRVTPLAERWTEEQTEDGARERTDIRVLLARVQRPILIEDLVADERLSERKRQQMSEMGLHSALVVPMMSDGALIGELALARRAVRAFGAEDARFLSAVAHQVAAMVRMATLVDGLQEVSERLENSQAETVFMLAAAAEAHDRTTGEHLRHIRVLSEEIARELGYDEASVRELGLAAMLHDIGKISVPDTVLSSPLRFDTDDMEIARTWETLKRHSVWGAEFLAGRQGFELAARVARWHHERWDGTGYPDALDGSSLPEEVTIVSVADAFDAMVSDRPYRLGRSADDAVREIVACSGKQFNPRVVEALVRLHRSGVIPIDGAEERRAA